ncbi:MAG TPA: hypothetical protein VIS94_01820 [Desulfomonilia bacterium]
MKFILKILKYAAIALIAFILIIGLTVFYMWIRPNKSEVNPAIIAESWTAVSDGMHNSNTHMINWNNDFWLVHANSPYHFATPKCKLMVWRSKDAKNWVKVTEFRVPGEDIRDPKFAVINGRLMLYVLKSIRFEAEPYTTAFTFTDNGMIWAPLTEIKEQNGWLFWNPKSFDGKIWYVPAYWYEHGKSALFKSTDGIKWEMVSTIHNGRNEITGANDRNDETDIEFLPGGGMIATMRMEGSDSLFGDKKASTNIEVALPPYTKWSEPVSDFTTRLDGPALFSYNGRIYAAGRYNPYRPGPVNYFGSIFAKKRTSLFLVTPTGLARLTDLPSAGDTSYNGVVIRDGFAYISYYTSNIKRDWPWLMGMVSASDIRIAKVDLAALEKEALKQISEKGWGQK